MQNTNDKQREHASKPSAGGDTSRHAGKPDKANPNSGAVAHPEKQNGKNRTEPLSNPGPSGGAVRPQKKDSNTSHADSKFSDRVG